MRRTTMTNWRSGMAGLVLATFAGLIGMTRQADAAGMRFEGEGLSITVTGYDPNTGQFSGQVTLDGGSAPYIAKKVQTPDGQAYATGQVKTGIPMAINIVDESDTVARVTLGGKTYRVKKVEAPQDDSGKPKREEPADLPPGPKGTIVMEPQTVIDRGQGNMKSHVLLVPKGWKVQGGAWWAPPKYFNTLPSQDIKVTSPAGVQVHIAPQYAARDYSPSPTLAQAGMRRPPEGVAFDGRIVFYMPQDLSQWAAVLKDKSIPISHPNAKDINITGMTAIPELTAMMRRQMQGIFQELVRQNRQSEQTGDRARSFADAAMLAAHATYEEGGKQWEQLMVFGVTHIGMDSESGRNLWWSIGPSVAFCAPKGTLNEQLPLLRAISTSVQPTPQWDKMRREHLAKMSSITAKNNADLAAAWRSTAGEVSDIIHQGWRKREAMKDETQRKVVNAIHGTENYTTGDGRSVQLPNNYKRVYTNNLGEYILTNDAHYNPSRDATVNNQDWKSMKPAKP